MLGLVLILGDHDRLRSAGLFAVAIRSRPGDARRGAGMARGVLIAAGGTILLVMACFGVWLFRLPDPTGLFGVLTLLAVFSCVFFAWSLLVTRGKALFSGNAFLSRAGTIAPEEAAQLPAFAAIMPFALMMMVCIRLAAGQPGHVFMLALLLDILLLALARYRKMELLAPVALVGTALFECIWLARNTPLAQPLVALGWAMVFYVLFMIFPFMFRRAPARTVRLARFGPGGTGAMAARVGCRGPDSRKTVDGAGAGVLCAAVAPLPDFRRQFSRQWLC